MLFARSISKPLNRMVTPWWEHSEGFSAEPRAWIAHQGRYIKALLAWLDHRGVSSPCIWSREIAKSKGPHSHILLHVPSHLAADFNEFAVQAGNFGDRVFAADSKPVVVSGGWPWEETGAETPAQQAALLKYAFKDIPADAHVGGVKIAEAIGFRPEHNSGPVMGKRVGVHRSISKAARVAAGFADITTLEGLRAALPTGEDARRQRRNQVGVSRHV